MRINRDVIVALALLVLFGAFFAASTTIRETSYGTMGSEVWPRIIIAFLTFFTLIYLANSLRAPPARVGGSGGLASIYASYRNVIWSFVSFGVFLALLPYLGMLIGGILFVFTTLSVLGGWRPRQILVHAIVSVTTVGAMWAVFTFGLRVILPQGELLRTW